MRWGCLDLDGSLESSRSPGTFCLPSALAAEDCVRHIRLSSFCRLHHYLLLQHLLQQHLLIPHRFPPPIAHHPASPARSHILSPTILILHCHHFAVFRIPLLLPHSSIRHDAACPTLSVRSAAHGISRVSYFPSGFSSYFSSSFSRSADGASGRLQWLVLYFVAIDTVFQNRPDGFVIAGAIAGVGFTTPFYTGRHGLLVYGVTYLPSVFLWFQTFRFFLCHILSTVFMFSCGVPCHFRSIHSAVVCHYLCQLRSTCFWYPCLCFVSDSYHRFLLPADYEEHFRVSFLHTCFAAVRVSYVPLSIYGR